MHTCRQGLLPTLILLWISSHSLANANFTFSYGDPQQCDQFPVSWSGGTPPFQLVLTPALGVPRTISIPDNNYSNGKGSFSTQLSFPEKSEFLATMSDANGWGSGGTSQKLVVGQSSDAATCNTTSPVADFFFDLDSALSQCRTYTFSEYNNAVQPIEIQAVIPGGGAFTLNPPSSRDASFNWVVDIAAGTNVLFIVTDAKGRQGGSSAILSVALTDDASCLTANSPSSFSIIPSPTSTGSSSTASSSGPSNPPVNRASNGGSIAAAVIGSVVALATIGGLILFCIRRKNKRAGGPYYGTDFDDSPTRRQRLHSVDNAVGGNAHHPVHPYPYTVRPNSTFDDSRAPPSASNLLSGDPYAAYSPSHSRFENSDAARAGVAAFADQSGSSSSSSRKGSVTASSLGATRFILHTDLEEVIELPPQYSERRAPIPGLDEPPPQFPPPPLESEHSRGYLEHTMAPVTPTSGPLK